MKATPRTYRHPPLVARTCRPARALGLVLGVIAAFTLGAHGQSAEANGQSRRRDAHIAQPSSVLGTSRRVVSGRVYHFNGSPIRYGSTRSIGALKAETERRAAASGNTLVFDIGGHFSKVDDYVRKIAADYEGSGVDFLCLTGYSWGSCVNDVAAALEQRHIPVDLLIYIDPINWTARRLSYGDVPRNVRRAYRFFTSDLMVHSRRDIAAVDPADTQCWNVRVKTPWYLWPIPLGRHISAPGHLTALIAELIVQAMNGSPDAIRFTKQVGIDRTGTPVYEVSKTNGWLVTMPEPTRRPDGPFDDGRPDLCPVPVR